MRITSALASLVVALAAAAFAGGAFADGTASSREALFRALGDETASVRDEAGRSLERLDGLTEDEVRAALRSADARARPRLFRIAAVKGMKGLVPDLAAALSAEDPVVTDAAVRALVSMGDEAVAAGMKALGDAKDRDAAAVRGHLTALAAQRAVEREVVSRWRRKGGSYVGRYAEIAKLGWPVQPVLLAMLLDVPLSDQHIVLPQTAAPGAIEAAKLVALIDIANSNRRGYRTFDPLPVHIEQEELFYLAAQALKDVADIEFLGDILESIASELEATDDRAGWRLRQWEESFYQEIDVVLFARGRGRRLERTAKKMKDQVDFAKRWVDRGADDRRADGLRQLSVALSEYAGVLHQLGRFDEAARHYAEVVQIGRELTGKDPAIAGYNRACALAMGGRKDEAIAQLSRALDRAKSAGSEDLTQEWVTEDGDLRTLHDDPRFAALIKRRFGDADEPPSGAAVHPEPPQQPPMPVPPQPVK